MTIQLRMGMEPLKAIPSLSKEGQGMVTQAGPSLHKEGQGGIEAGMDMVEQEELKPLQQQYTSLRDLISASATGRRRGGEKAMEWLDMEEFKFKDKLLKLAARAYLQPIVRESAAPPTHCLTQCWIAFASTNRSLVSGFIEGLHRQADACVKFLRTQTFNLLHRFKLQQHAAISQ